jgi:hypothetical protein
MKKAFFISLPFILLFIVSGCNNPTSSNTTTPPTQTVTATVEQSAFTRFVTGTGDNGTKYDIGYLEYIFFSSGGVVLSEEAYVKFYMPPIPSGASIESASLNIWITTFDASCTTNITQVTGAWNRTTISVTNEPALGSVRANIISTAVGWNYFDVTSLVRDWFNGAATNYGVRIYPSYYTSSATGSSLTGTEFKDYDDPQYYPRISINYK